MNSGDWLGILSGILILTSLGAFFYRVNQVSVPKNRTIYFTLMLISAALGVAAFVLDASKIGTIPAAFAIALGTIFPALRLQSAQDKNTPTVTVGGQIINFTADDDQGRPFSLASLKGQPFLLKFFRGHW